MTPEAQRIAIAEACGWTDVTPVIIKNVTYQGDDRMPGIAGRKPGAFDIEGKTWIPDYLSDLNAMAKAERVLFGKQLENYASALSVVADEESYGDGYGLAHWKPTNDYIGYLEMDASNWFVPLTATAAQRAEAFLRTIGKWDENQ